MRSKKIEEYKKSPKLNQVQRELLIGLMLGDGHLESVNGGRTYRLKIEYSASQDFYASWLYDYFREWVRTPPKAKTKRGLSTMTSNVWFQTYSHSAFRFYAQQFYRDGRRQVPKLIARWLAPRSLAVWFMDDGSYKSKDHRALVLNTQGFSQSDIRLLQKSLKQKYGIESQDRRQKDGMQILIVEPFASKFAKIIVPYVLPEFAYKFGKIGLTLLPKS